MSFKDEVREKIEWNGSDNKKTEDALRNARYDIMP